MSSFWHVQKLLLQQDDECIRIEKTIGIFLLSKITKLHIEHDRETRQTSRDFHLNGAVNKTVVGIWLRQIHTKFMKGHYDLLKVTV